MNGNGCQTDESIAALWDEYFKTRSTALRNVLVVHYLGLVKSIYSTLVRKLPLSARSPDLFQAGSLGLQKGIERFNPKRKVKFETHVSNRIRWAMIDQLREMDSMPRTRRSRKSKIQSLATILEGQHGRLSEDEIVEALAATGMSRTSVRTHLRVPETKLGYCPTNSQGVPHTIRRTRTHPSPTEEVSRKDLRNFLLRGLDRASRCVIILYYYENMSQFEIGQVLGVCESRVSDLREAALNLMRERLSTRDHIHFLR